MLRHREFAAQLVGTRILHGVSDHDDGRQDFGRTAMAAVVVSRSLFLRKVELGTAADGVSLLPREEGYEETIALARTDHLGRGMDSDTRGIPCEGMILDEKTALTGGPRFLWCLYADCIPNFMADPTRGVLAHVHAGRDSLVRRVPAAAVDALKRAYGVDPKNILVLLGPGIRTYRLQYFTLLADGDADPLWREFAQEDGEGVRVDLFGANRRMLAQAGAPPDQIYEFPKIDTFTDERFASHRRSLMTGEPEWRHAAVIGFAP